MSTMTFPIVLRNKCVTVSCDVFYSRGLLQCEEEVVVEHPNWALTRAELSKIQDTAFKVYGKQECEI